jgi:hypothetical protein
MVIPPPPRFLLIGIAALMGWFAWAYVVEKLGAVRNVVGLLRGASPAT